jgi:hypothetical protein
MQPSPPEWPPMQISAPPRERGFLLSAFMLLSMFGNLVLCVVFVLGAGWIGGLERTSDPLDPAAAASARFGNRIMLFLALLTVCNMVFLTGAWMWKKWGIYGYGLVSLLGMLAGLKLSAGSAMVSLAWGGIVGFLVATKWNHFE